MLCSTQVGNSSSLAAWREAEDERMTKLASKREELERNEQELAAVEEAHKTDPERASTGVRNYIIDHQQARSARSEQACGSADPSPTVIATKTEEKAGGKNKKRMVFRGDNTRAATPS